MTAVSRLSHRPSSLAWTRNPAAAHARQHKSCENSVAATVPEAYWRPFHLSIMSKPQMWFSLETQSPSRLEWRLGVKVSHICRFERTVWLAQTNRPRGQPPLPERGRAASYVDAHGRLRGISAAAMEFRRAPLTSHQSLLTSHLRSLA